jgi:hypothetical protein
VDEYEFTVPCFCSSFRARTSDIIPLGDASVAERAIESAVFWVRGRCFYRTCLDRRATGGRECVYKRAVYALFSFVGNEARAKLKLATLRF